MHNRLTIWLAEHAYLLSTIAGLSMVLFALSIIAAPWVVSKLPADFLLRSSPKNSPSNPLWLLACLLRNTLALILLLLGLIMLIAPGPGVIMLLMAVSIAQVPGKQKLIRRLATRESVFSSLNWMRKRHNKPPLIHPDT